MSAFGIHCFDGAGGHTCAAIDARLGGYVELEVGVATVDASDGTDVDAGLVFRSDARPGEDVGHEGETNPS
jgi:hypothetical protein